MHSIRQKGQAGHRGLLGQRGCFPSLAAVELARQRDVVDAYLPASREGEFGALLALLDPETGTEVCAFRFAHQVYPTPEASLYEGAAQLVAKALGSEKLAVAQAALEPAAGGLGEQLHVAILAHYRDRLVEVFLEVDAVEQDVACAVILLTRPFGDALGHQVGGRVRCRDAVGIERHRPSQHTGYSA